MKLLKIMKRGFHTNWSFDRSLNETKALNEYKNAKRIVKKL